MNLTKKDLKQLVKEAMGEEKKEWDVSKRTALPRVLSQILSALREAQDIIDGGHLDEERPVSPTDIENIKNIFEHPALKTLKKLGNISDEAAHEEAYGLDIDWGSGERDADWDY